MELQLSVKQMFYEPEWTTYVRKVVSLTLNSTRSVKLKWIECTLLLQWIFVIIYTIRYFQFSFVACAICQLFFYATSFCLVYKLKLMAGLKSGSSHCFYLV
jgi:hypothetical protein